MILNLGKVGLGEEFYDVEIEENAKDNYGNSQTPVKSKNKPPFYFVDFLHCDDFRNPHSGWSYQGFHNDEILRISLLQTIENIDNLSDMMMLQAEKRAYIFQKRNTHLEFEEETKQLVESCKLLKQP